MDKNLLKRFTLGSFILTTISLLILAFGKIDYNLSLLLLNQESIWAKFFYIFGEQPAFWGLLIGTVILLSVHNKTNKFLRCIYLIFEFILSSLCTYLILIIPLRYIYDNSASINNFRLNTAGIALVIGIIITTVTPKYEKTLKKYRQHAIFLILVILTEILFVSIMKYIWGRPRMRSISGFDEFRYWYEISGPALGQEFKSFPSGHTANAFTILSYNVFVPSQKKYKGRVFFFLAVIWGSLVAVSRVVLGAHFTSDVVAGFFVTLACIYFYYNLLLDRHK